MGEATHMSTAMVKQLRDRTGAGIMDCKRALEDSDGNLDKATELLRQQGIAKAGKKAGREARQGLIETYVHGGRIGAMVEINCETDFVARTDDFKSLAREIAMQVAAANPLVVNADDLTDEQRQSGVTDYGSEEQFIKERVLMSQPFIRDARRSMQDLVQEGIGKLGENIIVRRIARFELGETTGDESAETAAE